MIQIIKKSKWYCNVENKSVHVISPSLYYRRTNADADGIAVLAVGVGNGINISELRTIAKEDRVFTGYEFSQLAGLVPTLITKIFDVWNI